MPQNAIIKADGTGDYTSVNAWAAAESTSNYGAPTRCYIDGVVPEPATTDFTGTATDWVNELEIFAAVGQEFDGTNRYSCARLSRATSLITFRNVGIKIHGIGLIVGNTYNARAIANNQVGSYTDRKLVSIKNAYIESGANYHGSARAIQITAASTDQRFELDINNVVVYGRASINVFELIARTDAETFTGTVDGITLLPTNSGSAASSGFILTNTNFSPSLTVDNLLLLTSVGNANITDYAPTDSTATNVFTADNTGTATGATTAEFENYAAGDYRLKSSGSGNGAFPQAELPTESTPQETEYIDAVSRCLASTARVTQSVVANTAQARQRTITETIYVAQTHAVNAVDSRQKALAGTAVVSVAMLHFSVAAVSRHKAQALSMLATQTPTALNAVCRSVVQQLALSDELAVLAAIQRSYSETVSLQSAIVPFAVSSKSKMHATSLAVALAMQSLSVTAKQGSLAQVLNNADGPAPLNPQKLSATLVTSKLNAARLTTFLTASLITGNN